MASWRKGFRVYTRVVQYITLNCGSIINLLIKCPGSDAAPEGGREGRGRDGDAMINHQQRYIYICICIIHIYTCIHNIIYIYILHDAHKSTGQGQGTLSVGYCCDDIRNGFRWDGWLGGWVVGWRASAPVEFHQYFFPCFSVFFLRCFFFFLFHSDKRCGTAICKINKYKLQPFTENTVDRCIVAVICNDLFFFFFI